MIFNLLLQPGWFDYNHLYVFGKSLHQQEYKVLRKGLEAGLSKQQISNVFNSQEALGDIQFKKIQTLLSCSHNTRRISHISMLAIVLMIYPSWNSNSFVMRYGVKSTTL